MSDELREQIYNELNLKETEDLLEIWQANDHEEWSDTAFEIIREILSKRLGEVPPQELPSDEQENFEDDGLEEWETKLLHDENQPELYDTLEVLKLRDNINKVMLAAIVIYILLGLLSFPFIRALFQGIIVSPSEMSNFLPNIIATIISISFRIVITYSVLKALMQILRILMEIEFNSRKGIKPNPLVE